MNRNKLGLVIPLLAFGVICVAGVSIAHDPKTPVIAELLANPETFYGKIVTVYGLVVAVSDAGAVFTPQDVSQNPLRVVVAKGMSVAVQNQVLVRGVFRSDGGRNFIFTDVIQPLQGMGGACRC